MKTVSVVIPVYNGEVTIEKCIESILAQDYPKDKLEVIVVNNNSTDRTAEIVRQYPVTLLNESQQGVGAARNRGLAHARGELIASTDADCYVNPRWLSELVKPFEEKSVGGVGGTINGASLETAVERYAHSRPLLNHSFNPEQSLPYLITGNAAFRRELLNSVGGFDNNFSGVEDSEISWRIYQKGGCQFVFAPEAVVFHAHPRKLKDLFNQSFKYAETLHKFTTKFSKYEWFQRHSISDTITLYRDLIFVLPIWFAGRAAKWSIGRRTRDEMLYPFFEWVSLLGKAAGRIKCTIKHRRYYL